MHKRGELGSQFLMFAFMFILVIIGAGIVLGTFIFIGSEFDFRGVEANLLAYKIKSCLSNGDNTWLDNPVARNDLVLFSQKCGLNAQVSENYLGISISKKDSNDILFSYGSYNLCDPSGKDNNKFVVCSVTQTDKYSIVTSSNQRIRRNAY